MNQSLEIRPMATGEGVLLERILDLAVHQLTREHYGEEQRCAWSPRGVCDPDRVARIEAARPYVVALHGDPIAFADLQPDGGITYLFVHPDHVGAGHAGRLMDLLVAEGSARGLACLHADVSLTAEAFFRARGFVVTRRQEVRRRGETLRNARMELTLPRGGRG